MIENLLWEKYRPQSIDEIILLPRIRAEVSGGTANSNLILYGHFGTGKTTLAKLLVKGKPVMYFNTSLDTGIETLRKDITNHVNTISDVFSSEDTFKYVFLDEFEEASPKYQNALKAFIEEYSSMVRFIFVTNHTQSRTWNYFKMYAIRFQY
jgi:DNA polymerase III delta prime subunit